jgi:predicted peptidase
MPRPLARRFGVALFAVWCRIAVACRIAMLCQVAVACQGDGAHNEHGTHADNGTSAPSDATTAHGSLPPASAAEDPSSNDLDTRESTRSNVTGSGTSVAPTDGQGTRDPDAANTDRTQTTSSVSPVESSQPDASNGNDALGYWEYLPPNYGEAPLPLLVFTHGANWGGDGSLSTLETTLVDKNWPIVNLIRDDRWPNERPFIVLAPQNPQSGCFRAEDIDAFYRYATEKYAVDPSRIYHTGQSCGAVGALNYLGEHVDEFVTAAVLIATAGANDGFSNAGCDLGRVSIWALHNELDATTGGAEPSVDLISSLLDCSPTPDAKLTVYPGETAHDAWTKTYDLSAGNDVFAWLLEHTHE